MIERHDIVVVGAGLAGLVAAIDLQAAGRDVVVFERADQPGGRVATDIVDGFRLDRGFQVLNTSYPQVRRRLDLDALDVRPLTPGALVRYDGRLRRVVNPLRRPLEAPAVVADRLLPLLDLIRLGAYSARVVGPMKLLSTAEESATDAFAAAGLDGAARDRFLRPFLSGVLLESELATSRRFVDLVWRSFVRGRSVLPERGMSAIPHQLAGRLAPGSLRTSTAVERVRADAVDTADSTIRAAAVIVATDPLTAAHWLGITPPEMHGVTTFYHRAPISPLPEPTLVLDGNGSGPVINTVVLTEAVPTYSPDGSALVSSSVLTGADDAAVRKHLGALYAVTTSDWELVARSEVPFALPAFPPGTPMTAPARVADVWVAGDHRATPSIQGAMASGTAIARRILAPSASIPGSEKG